MPDDTIPVYIDTIHVIKPEMTILLDFGHQLKTKKKLFQLHDITSSISDTNTAVILRGMVK